MDEHNTIPVSNHDDEHNHLSSLILHTINTNHIIPYIYRVPNPIRRCNPEAYTPLIVSIGPFHHGNPSLSSMEYHKWRYLISVMNRNPRFSTSIVSSCIRSLKDVEIQARNSYGEEIDSITTKEFITILLLDSCFLIELFTRTFIHSSSLLDDPIVNSSSSIRSLRRDILLAENQIPMFVIERIYQILPISKHFGHKTLTDIALSFFKCMIPMKIEDLHEKFHREGVNLLDLVRSCYLCPIGDMSVEYTGIGRMEILGARKLEEIGGIRIKRAKSADSFMDLRFENGILMIPRLKISNHTETLLKNMIAEEQSRNIKDCSRLMTSYAFLMRNLVGDEADFNLLKQKKIITMSVSIKKLDFTIFDELCEGLDSEMENSCGYGELCRRIQDYNNRRKPSSFTLSWRRNVLR